MNPKWAEENLQTIRTLMERSAVYRRALAPIMLLAGVLGIGAAAIGILLRFESSLAFGLHWLTTAAIAVAGAFLVARRQALKEKDQFWSAPTRRVALALAPPLFAGLFLGVTFTLVPNGGSIDMTLFLPFLWALFYGCALHSAGFFMPRGVKWVGWIFIVAACSLLVILVVANPNFNVSGHWLMGIFFGGLHLAYGIYLYFTEKKSPNA